MKKDITTCSDKEHKPLIIKDLKKIASYIYEKEEAPIKKKYRWFEKIMNRFGWHRKYTVIIFDKSKLTNYLRFEPKLKILEKKENIIKDVKLDRISIIRNAEV